MAAHDSFGTTGPLTRSIGGTTRAGFQLRMPEGQYQLRSQGSSFHPPFLVPLSITNGQQQLDFGTVSVAAQGVSALKDKAAPDLMVKWRRGEKSSLAELRGHVVILDFWGYWCVPCVRDMPKLMDIAQQYKDQPVKWLAVHNPSLSTFAELDEKIAEFTTQVWGGRTMTPQTVIDLAAQKNDRIGVTGKRYGLSEWPTLIVINQKGVVVGPAKKDTIAAILDELLAATP